MSRVIGMLGAVAIISGGCLLTSTEDDRYSCSCPCYVDKGSLEPR